MEISLRELISIHRYSLFDLYSSLCEGASFRYLDGNGSTEWFLEAKTEDYRRLLRALRDVTQPRNAERLCHLYMQSPCGRIQVKEAHRRGLLSYEQYEDLQRTHSAFEAFVTALWQ